MLPTVLERTITPGMIAQTKRLKCLLDSVMFPSRLLSGGCLIRPQKGSHGGQ